MLKTPRRIGLVMWSQTPKKSDSQQGSSQQIHGATLFGSTDYPSMHLAWAGLFPSEGIHECNQPHYPHSAMPGEKRASSHLQIVPHLPVLGLRLLGVNSHAFHPRLWCIPKGPSGSLPGMGCLCSLERAQFSQEEPRGKINVLGC